MPPIPSLLLAELSWLLKTGWPKKAAWFQKAGWPKKVGWLRKAGWLKAAVLLPLGASVLASGSCGPAPEYDVVIRGGTLYDGSGSPALTGDLALNGDSIVALGDLGRATGRAEIDATGMAVSAGFINLMSWATETMIEDGRAMSDILQGVTLEVMGEGDSMGPIPDSLKDWAMSLQGDIKYEIEWNTLGVT